MYYIKQTNVWVSLGCSVRMRSRVTHVVSSSSRMTSTEHNRSSRKPFSSLRTPPKPQMRARGKHNAGEMGVRDGTAEPRPSVAFYWVYHAVFPESAQTDISDTSLELC